MIVQEFDCEPVLAVMETLLSVAYREFMKVLDLVDVTEQSSHLVHLLCSLQTSLLAWCYQHTHSDDKEYSTIAQFVLVKCKCNISVKHQHLPFIAIVRVSQPLNGCG